MSMKSNKSEYILLIVLIIITIAFLIFFMSKSRKETQSLVRTTLTSNVEGLLVCYTLFERLGIPVSRSYEMLVESSIDEHVGVLFLIEPVIQVNDGEKRYLKKWVSSGGVLVCTTFSYGLIEYLMGPEVFDFDDFGLSKISDNESTTVVPREDSQMPLARDVGEVLFASHRTFGSLDNEQEDVTALFSDKQGIRIFEKKLGSGRIIVLSDSSFMSDGRIGKADNSVLTVNVVSYSTSKAVGSCVSFDEYHLGFQSGRKSWKVLISTLSQSSAGWAVFALTAAGLLFLYYKGRQFGTRYTPDDKRRRSKMEFIDSIGATYRAANANRLSFRLIYGWFRRKCAVAAGLPESSGIANIAIGLSHKSRHSEDYFFKIFQRCEDALKVKRFSKRRFGDLINLLIKIELEVLDGYSKSK